MPASVASPAARGFGRRVRIHAVVEPPRLRCLFQLEISRRLTGFRHCVKFKCVDDALERCVADCSASPQRRCRDESERNKTCYFIHVPESSSNLAINEKKKQTISRCVINPFAKYTLADVFPALPP